MREARQHVVVVVEVVVDHVLDKRRCGLVDVELPPVVGGLQHVLKLVGDRRLEEDPAPDVRVDHHVGRPVVVERRGIGHHRIDVRVADASQQVEIEPFVGAARAAVEQRGRLSHVEYLDVPRLFRELQHARGLRGEAGVLVVDDQRIRARLDAVGERSRAGLRRQRGRKRGAELGRHAGGRVLRVAQHARRASRRFDG